MTQSRKEKDLNRKLTLQCYNKCLLYGKGFKDNIGTLLVTVIQKPRALLNIQLIYYEKCPGSKFALANLQDIMAEENIKDKIHIFILSEEQEAKNLRITGSPTIRINNKDVDPSLEKSATFSLKCRSYSCNGKVTGWPDKELIRRSLREATKKD